MKSYIQNIKRMPQAVLLFLFSEVILCVGLGIWSFSLNFLLEAKGLSGDAIGGVVAASQLVTAVLAVFLGTACNRIGYRRSLVLGCGIKALAILATLTAPAGIALYGARILNGIGDCFLLITEYPYITSLAEEESKNLVYTLLFGTTAFSVFLGNTLGGAVLGRLDISAALPIAAAAGILITAAAAMMRLRLPDTVTIPSGRFRIYKPEKKSIGIYMLYEAIGYAGYAVAYSMITLICRNRIGLSLQATGVAVGVMSVTSSIAVFLCQPLADRFGRARSVTVVLALLAILYFVMGISGKALFVMFVIVTAMMQFMLAGFVDGPMLGKVSESNKSTYTGMRLLLNSIATSGGTYAAGALLDIPDTGFIYIVVGASVLVQLLMFLTGFRKELADK